MQYAISRNPQWHIKFNAFTDASPDFPLLTGLGQVVFGLNKESPELVKAVNAEIAKLWQTCELRKIGKTYGLVQDVWFVPVGQNPRAGVDRPADWKAAVLQVSHAPTIRRDAGRLCESSGGRRVGVSESPRGQPFQGH
jgi:hypothetical protein